MLESFYGGSHRDVADGIASHSRHSVDLITLPSRFWKWRVRGASLWFARNLRERFEDRPLPYDILLSGGMMDIAALRSLLGPACPPVVLYAHETQLAYPQQARRDADLHFAFTDLVNMLAADRVLFNSESHRSRYLTALPEFLRLLPEYRPMWAVQEVAAKSEVCYPGIAVPEDILCAGAAPRTAPDLARELGTGPLIIWNHRWEFDKDPERFFAVIRQLAAGGSRFRVALLGESFATKPEEFIAARSDLGSLIVRYGYVADRREYERWLSRGNIVVSTAIQENFGISVMEAIAHGCHPVLPARLSYPELVPEKFHGSCLYDDDAALYRLLESLIERHSVRSPITADRELVSHARSFAWPERIGEFDRHLASAASVTRE